MALRSTCHLFQALNNCFWQTLLLEMPRNVAASKRAGGVFVATTLFLAIVVAPTIACL